MHTVSVNVTSFFVDSDIKFTTKQMISSIKFYISYAMDSTYSPLLVSILYGQDGQQYKEFKTFSISEVNDWFVVRTVRFVECRWIHSEIIIHSRPFHCNLWFMKCTIVERIQEFVKYDCDYRLRSRFRFCLPKWSLSRLINYLNIQIRSSSLK